MAVTDSQAPIADQRLRAERLMIDKRIKFGQHDSYGNVQHLTRLDSPRRLYVHGHAVDDILGVFCVPLVPAEGIYQHIMVHDAAVSDLRQN